MSWSPFGAAVAAAVLVALGFAVGQWRAIRPLAISAPDAPTPAGEAPAGPQVVQFVLVQPGASRVALVGDFNGWDVDASPMRRDAGGAWSIALPLLPGRHVYAFVVDGRRWVADPVAPLAPEEDFGFHNSVVVVGEQGSI
jgi:1,4-alpha-glucan branching enzyme